MMHIPVFRLNVLSSGSYCSTTVITYIVILGYMFSNVNAICGSSELYSDTTVVLKMYKIQNRSTIFAGSLGSETG